MSKETQTMVPENAEPVYQLWSDEGFGGWTDTDKATYCWWLDSKNPPRMRKLYTAPVATQPGLTQQTLDDVKAGIPARDAEIEALRKEIEALQAALAQPQRLIFPTMLRKMWSGSEVQAWLDEELAKLTKLSSQQVTDKTDAGQGYNDGFSDGVILALQLMTMHGDYNGTQYCELFNAAGPNQIVERAIREGMWEMSGLSQTPAAVERRAAIEAARKENSNA